MDGITRGLPFTEYLALPGVHFSSLKPLDVSPLHYRHALRAPVAESDAMALGRIVHAMILTGALPDDMAVYEGPVRRGKTWEAFAAENAGKTITRKSELGAAGAMHAAVMRHPEARELLREGEGEITVRWSAHGFPCRGRLDWYTGERIVELKTTRSISPRVFLAECATRLYHAQLAFYSAGYAAATGEEPPVLPALIAVENMPPYDVAVYRVGFDVLEAGARKVEFWLSSLARCEREKRWPGVDGGAVLDMRLPEWATTEGLPDVDLDGIGGEDG